MAPRDGEGRGLESHPRAHGGTKATGEEDRVGEVAPIEGGNDAGGEREERLERPRDEANVGEAVVQLGGLTSRTAVSHPFPALIRVGRTTSTCSYM